MRYAKLWEQPWYNILSTWHTHHHLRKYSGTCSARELIFFALLFSSLSCYFYPYSIILKRMKVSRFNMYRILREPGRHIALCFLCPPFPWGLIYHAALSRWLIVYLFIYFFFLHLHFTVINFYYFTVFEGVFWQKKHTRTIYTLTTRTTRIQLLHTLSGCVIVQLRANTYTNQHVRS